MADKDFSVKNGLQINGATWVINSTAFFFNGTQFINSTSFAGQSNTANVANTSLTSNNALNLGGVAPQFYINTTSNYTLSGNLNFTGANVSFGTGLKIGSNVVANTQSLFFGNSSVNLMINSIGVYVGGGPLTSGGGYYKGNNGEAGNTSNKGNLFRINSNTQTNNITIAAGENAMVAGPLAIQPGYTLTVSTGGRVVIL